LKGLVHDRALRHAHDHQIGIGDTSNPIETKKWGLFEKGNEKGLVVCVILDISLP
jgi:hypothetical protein